MITLAVILFAAQAAVQEPYGLERCSAEDGPEVGVGILCDRARLALEARELSVADEISEIAARLAPSHPGVWVVRAEVAQNGRRVDEARRHYEKAAELEPSNPAILVEMGDFEAEEGNVRGAAVLYEKAAELDPGFPGLAERLEAIGDDPAPSEI
ncbi:tetratricopeptide repeat protein [Parvularcula lutaonensis]|uniref:Tetratricopeptide repeat protein n=1 Tax=Parvularcula lutaonensis TaxID=491923 RepID=A0ABV7M7Q3_9PROT|nr:tetratricopeptide repeat protein [Parvularcula lutaonensis]GGY42764.1 hypothetical protein GCM10007148_09300 [Parvularcula lutaonensis]